MTILKEWLANRGVFDEVSYGVTELEIVSLNKKLIEELKALPRWRDMYEFVAKHGLSDARNRLSEDENLSKDIPAIWLIPDFAENQKVIVDDICELSGITSILADKLEVEEKDDKEMAELEAAENTNVINGDASIQDISLGQLHEDAALNP
jgi:hypothetical protein